MKNLSICKELVKASIKENNERYEGTNNFELYALIYDENEKSINIYPRYETGIYSPQCFIDAANACECYWYIGLHLSEDGKNQVSIHIF